MVAVALPPPALPPKPVFYKVINGTELLRMYDPCRFDAAPMKFRHFGPMSRFDHHRAPFPTTADDPDRGIIYAAKTISGCIVEIFGDTKIVQVDTWEIARLTVTRELKLLDLRGSRAMNAGTIAAVCKDSNRQFSQAWSRFFYENSFVYDKVDGLIWGNAHNDEDAFAFYERCQNGFKTSPAEKCPLRDDALRVEIKTIAARTNMHVQPY